MIEVLVPKRNANNADIGRGIFRQKDMIRAIFIRHCRHSPSSSRKHLFSVLPLILGQSSTRSLCSVARDNLLPDYEKVKGVSGLGLTYLALPIAFNAGFRRKFHRLLDLSP
jgi:hypothetical protein